MFLLRGSLYFGHISYGPLFYYGISLHQLEVVGSVVLFFACCSMRTRTLSNVERGQIIEMQQVGMEMQGHFFHPSHALFYTLSFK